MIATEQMTRVISRPPKLLICIAAVILLTSILALALIALVLIAHLASSDGRLPTSQRVLFVAIPLLSLLGLPTAFGLFRLQRWARSVCIGIGFVAGYWGLILALASLFTTGSDGKALGFGICAYSAVLGFSSALYLLRGDVSERFGINTKGLPRPIGVWAVGWMLLSGTLAEPLRWMLSDNSTIDSTLFGAVFLGTSARILDFIFSMTAIALAAALFRKTSWAYWSAVSLYLLCTMDQLVDLTSWAQTHYAAVMIQAHRPLSPRTSNLELVTMLFVLKLLPLLILIGGWKKYRAWPVKRTFGRTHYS